MTATITLKMTLFPALSPTMSRMQPLLSDAPGHSHPMTPSLETSSHSYHVSITNNSGKSSTNYPNTCTATVLSCHTPGQSFPPWPYALRAMLSLWIHSHTKYLYCHKCLTHTATSTSHSHTNSSVLSCTQAGRRRAVAPAAPPQLGTLLLNTSITSCLSRSLSLSLSRRHGHTRARTRAPGPRGGSPTRAAEGGGPARGRWRCGLCPGQGGGRPEGDVERPRGAARGRARRRRAVARPAHSLQPPRSRTPALAAPPQAGS
ncbi:cell growth regulator with EF hand domain protein 1 isoform X2 [Acinonyx jubatus]|uniref:Cell growth regulator with EF hand domain protein 1 isoform X2 n=1 Tax=Acinonyx jubatus TaxID=32536 RepID=A0ABM3NCD8_ACIJB|nr:cell growth regulator with EF hand domain protein 1 isoform X2 [Acinonyx jubatus]